MNLIWCRITAKYLVQNKKQISAKKAENLQSLEFNFSSRIHVGIHGMQYYMRLCLGISRQEKRLKPLRFKPFRFIFSYISSYKTRYLVEVARDKQRL